MKKSCLTIAAIGVLTATGLGTAPAAELWVLTGMGPSTGVYELASGFEKATGNQVKVTFENAQSLAQKLDSNAPVDLITGGAEQIDDLIKKGKVVAGTSTVFGTAPLGLSVRMGAPHPDISTVEKYKAALLAAKSVGYSRGCSGTNTAKGIEELGITDALKDKVKLTAGGPVAEYLAKGDFALGIQQTNVLVGIAGTDLVGPLPGFTNKPCPFNVGLMSASKQPDLARQLIRFMTDPNSGSYLQKGYMEPVRSRG